MRVNITENPFPMMTMPGHSAAEVDCPARWIWHQDAPAGQAQVVLFRLVFQVEQATMLRMHVSADQRYELFLDGERLGRGPGRSDLAHWFFESYDQALEPGEHLLAARVWWLPGEGAPMAQMSGLPGFLVLADGLSTDGALAAKVSTGSGAWQAALVHAYRRIPAQVHGYHVVGWSFALDAAHLPWGWQSDRACPANWAPAVVGNLPIGRHSNPYYDSDGQTRHVGEHHLMPNPLPPMIEVSRSVGTVRHAQTNGAPGERVTGAASEKALAATWQALLDDGARVTVAPHSKLRLIVDLDDYYCAYPELVVSGGLGAEIGLGWAESLFLSADPAAPHKGQRDQVEGKWFHGPHDSFYPDGGAARTLDTLWWRSGRYLQLLLTTAEEALIIEQLTIRETRYPLERLSAWESSDPRLAGVVPVLVRGLQMCSHETYMDCPYYEQLMYVGDTRLEVLTTYVVSDDNRLPELACSLFDWSRAADGLTKSRYPSALPQVIPPFSLWWVGMIYDHFMWRDDHARTRAWLPGVSTVLTAFERNLGADGLVAGMPGWNFVDWVPEWNSGFPPGAMYDANAAINLQYLDALQRAVVMFESLGQPWRAEHWRQVAQRLKGAILAAFWDDRRGMLADDRAHGHWSEHAQALAIITELVAGKQRQRVAQALFGADGLARATIYFSHYLFEAIRAMGRPEEMFSRLQEWLVLPDQGFKTTREKPEPSRSDCHAWGAHPLYHYYASILGARPAEPGFRSIAIAPQPGPLTWLKGAFPWATGEMVVFDLRFAGGQIAGSISLPPGLSGTLIWAGEARSLRSGANGLG